MTTEHNNTERKSFADLKREKSSIPEEIATAAVPKKNAKRRNSAIVLSITGVAVVGALLVVGATTGVFSGGFGSNTDKSGGLTPAQSEVAKRQSAQAETKTSEQPTDEHSTKATKGVQGHAVSPAFCAALEAAAAVQVTDPMSFPQEAQDAWAAMAELESPNQKVYQAFATFTKDPAAIDSNTVLPAYTKAITEDAAACA